MSKKIKYTPEQKFTVVQDGFYGEFYRAENDRFPGKCIIAFGGSMGLFLLTQWMAEKFIDEGMSVMAIAYHGEEGLPDILKDQPVDVVENAAMWLKKQGFGQIGLWGISMGGCLALLAGSLMPDLISCVVAVAPMEMIPQAEDKKGPIEGSAFSWHGKPLPYLKYDYADSKELMRKYKRDSWKHKEPWARDYLENAYKTNDNPDAVIKVWDINGPILLLGSAHDSMCPDVETIARLQAQLKEHDFCFPVESHIYPAISHLIVPFRPYSTPMFHSERKDKAGCAADRVQSWKDTLRFLREKW